MTGKHSEGVYDRPMPNVLLVGGDPDSAVSLARSLFQYGHHVERAPSSRIAQLLIDEGYVPDVVVIDVAPPGADGFETARDLRAHPFLNKPRLPIVMMIETSEADYAQRFGELDAKFLEKPFNSSTLQGAILIAIRNEKAQG